MNAMNVAPLGVVDVAYYSNHAAQYLQNLLKTVEKLPFLQEVIDDLAADTTVNWNCQTGGALGNDHIHAIELEIAPIYDDGEYVETFTFEDSVSEPDRVHAFSLYSRVAESSDFAGVQPLHDAESLAECEMMALLAVRRINEMKANHVEPRWE
ncbi:hypothetical protein Rahaq_5060 (plasmid) [Rahnella aceris]|uniref:Uncharacterized protein n=2 Tax=Rahnella sp. (strain Y9602) TaxID=2703885 RepID=A0A0H3FHJ7_RAHSY|nr:hypothetical protein Rahaq_5060 [Rahnella aceris]